MRIERRMYLDNRAVQYIDEESGHVYGMIVAGLGWPTTKDGCLIVAGAEFLEDPKTEAFRIRILVRVMDFDLSRLFLAAINFQDELAVEKIYTDTKNETMMRLKRSFNKEREAAGRKPINLIGARGIEDSRPLELYGGLIRRSWRRGVLDPGHELGSELQNIPSEAISKGWADNPLLLSLGYAVEALSRWKGIEKKQTNIYHPDNSFDIFSTNYGQKTGKDFDPFGRNG